MCFSWTSTAGSEPIRRVIVRWRAVEVKKRLRTWELLARYATSSIQLQNNLVIEGAQEGVSRRVTRHVLVTSKLWLCRIKGKGWWADSTG